MRLDSSFEPNQLAIKVISKREFYYFIKQLVYLSLTLIKISRNSLVQTDIKFTLFYEFYDICGQHE